MRICLFLLTISFLILCTSILQAHIIHVPGDSTTIQSGINGAVDGDTVLVADGTYTGDGNRDIDFGGRSIVVMSENGPEVTIIDCEGSEAEPHRGFYFNSGEDSSSVVQGFTIRSGVHNSGGGVYCYSSSPTISNCIISGNKVTDVYWGGGGIFCDASSSPTISNCIISGNSNMGSYGDAGGIFCRDSSPTISNCIINYNSANDDGGGIACHYFSSPEISNCTLSGNAADYRGGGIYCVNSSPTITNCTITNNTALYGGVIYDRDSSPMPVINSILWGDIPNEITLGSGGNIIINYSNIQGGWGGTGNIDEDPMFVLPDKDDYRLLWDSPCIDTGHPDSLDPDSTRSDMGAHFLDQRDYLTLYLTPDTTEVAQGGELGVTYTLINRWDQPEPFWGLTQAILPSGNPINLIGPDQFTLPSNTTIQRHFDHDVPAMAPLGHYEYWSRIGLRPSTLYDEDRFTFSVVE